MADLTREQIEAMRLTLEEHLNMSYAHGVEDALNTLCDMALRSLRQSEREGWVCVSKAALERAIADAFMEHLERPENWRRVFEDEALWISREVVRRVTEGK